MALWKAVPGWEGWYEVSSYGAVRSVDRTIEFSDGRVRKYKGRMLQQYRDDFGYPKVTLKKNGVDWRVHVHVLVALAFIGPRPAGMQVLHDDGNPKNARITNLRYGTPLENHADTLRHGNRAYGERSGPAKLKSFEVTQIKKLRGVFTCREIADMFGTSPSNVCNIQQGKRWVHHVS